MAWQGDFIPVSVSDSHLGVYVHHQQELDCTVLIILRLGWECRWCPFVHISSVDTFTGRSDIS